MNVSEAVASRSSIRRYLDKPVDMALLREILVKAQRSPSGGNLQPWHIHVVSGAKMIELKALMSQRLAADPAGEGTEYDIYPKKMSDTYSNRRYEVGQLLYARLGIPREDKQGRARWFARNYEFFGAPAGLFCYVERDHGMPQWADCGMYLQTVMLLLREAGLDSCAQECWALYHRTIDDFLAVSASQMLFTGMSIGWRDPDSLENTIVIPRAAADESIHFHLA